MSIFVSVEINRLALIESQIKINLINKIKYRKIKMKTLIKSAIIIMAMTLLFIKIYVPMMSEKSNEQVIQAENQNLKENSGQGERKVVLK